MTIEDIYIAVVDAVAQVGQPHHAPLEIAKVTRDGTSDVYTVSFNDARKSTPAEPIFTIDVDTGTYQTIPSIQAYITERIASHISELDKAIDKPPR